MTDYRYASGEEPRKGDIVRLTRGMPINRLAAGDVAPVTHVGFDSSNLIDVEGDVLPDAGFASGRWNPRAFELIARAGEPVRYQPGDVVEFLRDSCQASACSKGDRDTVTRLDTDGDPVLARDFEKGRGWTTPAAAEFFKLVHRPAKTEPLVFTPPEPQEGDRVRVTFEAKVGRVSADGSAGLTVKGGVFNTPFSAKEMAQATVEIIERAEKPLAVGDEVAFRTTPPLGVIRAIDNGKAWIKGRDGYVTERLEDLIRVQSL